MSKTVAVGILTTMLLGLCGWAGSSIVESQTKIASLETDRGYVAKDIAELKEDTKAIRATVDSIDRNVRKMRR